MTKNILNIHKILENQMFFCFNIVYNNIKGVIGLERKVVLSPKKIVAKEFKVDFKGYNAEEVDHFLDLVVKDYETFAAMLNASYDRIDQLEKRISEQKIQITKLEREKALQDDNIHAMEENLSTNVDILKRLSLLEKAVFGKK